jgi:flagellar protein FliO/FliZ
MDSVVLVVRVVFSLVVVLAMMWGLSRVMRGGRPASKQSGLEVVSRTTVGRRQSILVLRAGDRGLVVGVTDHTISVLGDIELPQDAAAPEERTPIEVSPDGSVVLLHPGAEVAAPRSHRRRAAAPAGKPSALAGSVLSPVTWRQTATALRERTVRQ